MRRNERTPLFHAAAAALLLLNLAFIADWPIPSRRDVAARFYARMCHQLPERSCALDGKTLPVCARCWGVCLGMTAMALGLCVGGRGRRPSSRVVLGLLALLAGDWLAGLAGVVPATWKSWRVTTGFLGGCGLYALFYISLLWLKSVDLPKFFACREDSGGQ